MKRYVKKPIPVEAWQLTNYSIQDIVNWINDSNTDTRVYWAGGNDLTIDTLEGEMFVREGSYVIRGVRGEFYGCEESIFEETYEEVL